jgi:trk system potassium uptake protein TrkH
VQIQYKNNTLEKVLLGTNILASSIAAASLVLLYGFHQPRMSVEILYPVQLILLIFFVAEKTIRFFNAVSKKDFFRANWFEIPLLLALAAASLAADRLLYYANAADAIRYAVGIYLAVQIIVKLCRTCINMAASGRNPTQTLILSFLVLIITGAGLLMLPRASAAAAENVEFIDALFTATSATCVTGLTVKDTGTDFSLMGQLIILTLIQLGGLGIVVFGAVFALLLGQALSLRERVAMQDILSAGTLGKIGSMIVFIFAGTFIIETIGVISLFGMWDNSPVWIGNVHHQWFASIFHSISAFCNAGLCLFSNSLGSYNRNWQVYGVICPLIVLGGLGFGVLYDLASIGIDRVKRFFKKHFSRNLSFLMEPPPRMLLQTKIVLTVSALLIIAGTLAIFFFERYAAQANPGRQCGILDALFQSVTARTAGFSTIDISALSPSSKFILILLMLVGGSPGGTAGGIKTVTLAVVIMAVITTLRKRDEVEIFGRSVRLILVRRAITVMMLFIIVFFAAALALSVTEASGGFTMLDIIFEAASALGTVGLSTGITASLTTAGKSIIIALMLIGRLGPLTLLAALTFNIKPVRYGYPEEAIIVG